MSQNPQCPRPERPSDASPCIVSYEGWSGKTCDRLPDLHCESLCHRHLAGSPRANAGLGHDR